MILENHNALAGYLLQNADTDIPYRYRLAFRIGCLEPDRNPLTYLRGSMHHRFLHGHNTENLRPYLCKELKIFEKRKPNSLYDWYRFGTIIHYLADSFTYPHTPSFHGSLKDHLLYEKTLSAVFHTCLEENTLRNTDEKTDCLSAFISGEIRYNHESDSPEKDCRYILDTCSLIFRRIVSEAPVLQTIPNEIYKEKLL